MDIDKVGNWSFVAGFQAARDAGFSGEEMQHLLQRWSKSRDEALTNRIKDLPKGLRDAIGWGMLIDFAVPCNPPDITPDRCYFVLPIKHAECIDEYDVLLLSPISGQWARVPLRYSSDLVEWLNGEGDVFASGWIRAMIGEFGLGDDMLGAWITPVAGRGMLDARACTIFWRELKVARCKELAKRLVDAAEWVEGMGIPNVTKDSCFLAIPPSDIDYDPERTAFVIPFVLVGKECSLVFASDRRIPILCQESFKDVELLFKRTDVEEQQRWLGMLLRE